MGRLRRHAAVIVRGFEIAEAGAGESSSVPRLRTSSAKTVVLAGGTGRRQARHASSARAARRLTVIANTPRDDEFWGLLVSRTWRCDLPAFGCLNEGWLRNQGRLFACSRPLERLGEPHGFVSATRTSRHTWSVRRSRAVPRLPSCGGDVRTIRIDAHVLPIQTSAETNSHRRR